jgi:dolichol-phosphate mannosyltransferase
MFSLVVPTYNEAKNLPVLVLRVVTVLERMDIPFEIIVVDDDSPDGTWRVAEELAVEEPRLRVMRRRGQRGLASAVVLGWRHAKGRLLGVIDADLQHPPETLEELVKVVADGKADVAIASRHRHGAGISENWSPIRRMVSAGASLMAFLTLPSTLRRVSDPMSGFFALRREVVEGIELSPTGYKILLEVLGRGRVQSVVEVPFVFAERLEGQSKLGARQYVEYVVHLLRLSRATGELGRFLRFCLVGMSGVAVNLGALWLFKARLGFSDLVSVALAVETAMVSNFALNDAWTFGDLRRSGVQLAGRVVRFLRFNLVCAVGALVNVGTFAVLTGLWGVHYMISGAIGIGVAAALNYVLNTVVTWEKGRSPA